MNNVQKVKDCKTCTALDILKWQSTAEFKK
jgi:hypothetical protein